MAWYSKRKDYYFTRNKYLYLHQKIDYELYSGIRFS
jgi:hypothetical protein